MYYENNKEFYVNHIFFHMDKQLYIETLVDESMLILFHLVMIQEIYVPIRRTLI